GGVGLKGPAGWGRGGGLGGSGGARGPSEGERVRPETIAIDGPAGSGKSTIGQALAARLYYAMVDTGLIYRLVARGVLDSAVDPDDMEAVLKGAVGVLNDVQVARAGPGGAM